MNCMLELGAAHKNSAKPHEPLPPTMRHQHVLPLLGLVALVVSTVDVAYASDCIVLFDYNAREADELSVRRGDPLVVVSAEASPDEGWVHVPHQSFRGLS